MLSLYILAFAASLQDAVREVIDPEAMAFGGFYHDVGKIWVPPGYVRELPLIKAATLSARQGDLEVFPSRDDFPRQCE